MQRDSERRMCEDAEGDGEEHTLVGGGSRTREVGAYLALTARLDASCRGFPAPSLRNGSIFTLNSAA